MGKDFYRPDTVTAAPLAVDSLKQYTGRYNYRTVNLNVEAKDGKLYVTSNNGEPMRMYYTTKGDFVLLEERAASGW